MHQSRDEHAERTSASRGRPRIADTGRDAPLAAARRRGSPVSGAELLGLQRLAGNDAVVKYLGSRGAPITVQRAVGFELEDDSKTAMLLKRPLTTREIKRHRAGREEAVALPGGNVNPAVSVAPVKGTTLKSGTNFELQSDEKTFDTGNQGGIGIVPVADLEFVTEPLTETNLASARQVAADVGEICRTLDAAPRGHNQWILPEDNPVTRGSLLLQSFPTWTFKVQHTAEIRNRHIANVMEDVGKNVTETPLEANRRDPGRAMLHGITAPGAGRQIMGTAPTLARGAIGNLHGVVGGATFAPGSTDSLVGVIAIMVQYIKMASMDIPSYAKVIAPLMSRHSLAKLFSTLPQAQRNHLAGGGGLPLVNLVLYAVNSRLNMHLRDTHYAVGMPVFRNLKPNSPVLNDVTIGDWLQGVANGRDLLTAEDYERRARAQAAGGPITAKQTEGAEQLESLGAKGMAHRRQDVTGHKAGAFEVRSAARYVPLANLEDYMVTILNYYRNLARNDNATLTPEPNAGH